MNPKKENGQKAKNAGISLEPDLKARATDLAKKLGLKSLSALTHKLFSEALEDAAQSAEKAGREKQQRGKGKINAAREKK